MARVGTALPRSARRPPELPVERDGALQVGIGSRILAQSAQQSAAVIPGGGKGRIGLYSTAEISTRHALIAAELVDEAAVEVGWGILAAAFDRSRKGFGGGGQVALPGLQQPFRKSFVQTTGARSNVAARIEDGASVPGAQRAPAPARFPLVRCRRRRPLQA